MPFKSDKQRRFLWSQKPEVAKQIAHKQGGGRVRKGIQALRGSWDDLKPNTIEEALDHPATQIGGSFIPFVASGLPARPYPPISLGFL